MFENLIDKRKYVRYIHYRTVVRNICLVFTERYDMSEAMRAAASLYNNPRYFSESEIRIRKNKIRRQKIYRRQVFMLSLTVACLMFMIIFITSTILTNAQSDEAEFEYKYYKTVMVHADDTLWDIASANYSAEHYSDMNGYINEICNINSLSDRDNLNAGEALIVPYYSTEFK